jgi:LmbE family N-acetylglucosaminyl deacetylase
LDDAVFSCGGTLGRLADAGWDVVVCTAFTRSVLAPTGFALACQLDKGLSPDADYMAIRRAEDTEACHQLGCTADWLDFVEAPHRGYGDAKSLFGLPREADDVLGPLSLAFAAILDRRPDLVLAPQAVGGHVDHVMLVRALRVVRSPSLPILWWTDFPYATRLHLSPTRPFISDMIKLTECVVTGDIKKRLSACAAYVTQISYQFGSEQGLIDALQTAGPSEWFRLDGAVPAAAASIVRIRAMSADQHG